MTLRTPFQFNLNSIIITSRRVCLGARSRYIKLAENDEAQNLIYIDPGTGKVVTSFTRNSKIHRWLYQGLHKFNFQFLVEHNWLRKILLIILSLGGIVISFSGVVLSWKWIKRKTKKHKKDVEI